jgi:CRISPR-associated protein Csb1
MPDDRSLESAIAAPRILIEASLQPVQGTRFQPTGFPSLGAAEFQDPSGATNLLVESAQSMANRLEAAAWDDVAGDLVEALRGIPYVATTVGDKQTDSIREAHRLNSPYLFYGIAQELSSRTGVSASKKKTSEEKGESSGIDVRRLAAAVFYYDPNSVLHGVFLEKLVGAARLTRILSAFIEAHKTSPAESGGVKNDRIDPAGGFGGAARGYGNVPFSRTEYTAQEIVAYFNIDTHLLRSYGLSPDAEQLLTALALWKVQKFLESGGRLRTACDFEAMEVRVTRPADWVIPSLTELEEIIARTIQSCRGAGVIADPPKTVVEFVAPK